MTSASPEIKYAYLCAFREIVGGGQVGMLLHFKHADRARFTPLLLCPGPGEVSDKAAGLGIKTFFLNWPAMRPHSLLAIFKTVRELRALFASNGVSVAHTDTLELAALAGLASLFSPVKTVFHARVSDSGGLWDRLIQLLAARIICVSHAAAKRFPKSEKLLVIYNGVEKAASPLPEETSALRKELGLGAEHIVVGYCGQLLATKGLPTLFHAFALLKTSRPEARLLLSGRGEEAELKSLANELGIGGETIFSGFRTDNSAVRACIDIFVLPGTHAEGLPRTVLEGMALGRPTVLTPCGGSVEAIIDGESGFFVPPGDPAALAEKLSLLAGDGALRAQMGSAAKKRMLDLFEIEKTTRAIEAVYQELLK